VGQKDDTRENPCVTETKRDRGEERREGGKGRTERDGFTESEKPHTHTYIYIYIYIDIRVSMSPERDDIFARVRRRHASATKCI